MKLHYAMVENTPPRKSSFLSLPQHALEVILLCEACGKAESVLNTYFTRFCAPSGQVRTKIVISARLKPMGNVSESMFKLR